MQAVIHMGIFAYFWSIFQAPVEIFLILFPDWMEFYCMDEPIP